MRNTPPLSTPRRWRGARLGLAAALAVAALDAGCAEDPPAAPVDSTPVDAGPPCERGTLGCACRGGSSCDDELLCNAGLCLANEGTPEPDVEPPVRPPPERPPSNVGDAGDDTPSAPPDAGLLDAGLPDTSGLDASAPDASP